MFCSTFLGHIAQKYNTESAKYVHDQWVTQEILAYNWLTWKPRGEKMKGKHTWRKLQEDKHNCSNQNKAWSRWHISLTFRCVWHLHKPCFCSVSFVLRPKWLMETEIPGLHMHYCFYLSNLNLWNIPVITLSPWNCRLKQGAERLGNIRSGLHPAITAHITSYHLASTPISPATYKLWTLVSSHKYFSHHPHPLRLFSVRGYSLSHQGLN